MSEFRRYVRNISLLVALGIGTAACGGDGDNVEAAPKPALSGITRDVRYFDDGSRIIRMSGIFESRKFATDIYGFCDTEGSLVEQSLSQNGFPNGSIQRTLNYLPCADGRLTAEDFMPPAK